MQWPRQGDRSGGGIERRSADFADVLPLAVEQFRRHGLCDWRG